jgi:hypothetical protein
VIGATVVGFFFGAFLVLMQAALRHMKKDPGASAKLVLLKSALTSRRSKSVFVRSSGKLSKTP